MYTSVNIAIPYFDRDTKQSSATCQNAEKTHKVHVSLHTVDDARHTKVLARRSKLNTLKRSSLMRVVPIVQH